jgi:zinc transport system ATP-binding protein
MHDTGGKKLMQAEGLSLGYEGRIVLKDLSFTLDRGDYFCVVGENGSGKTTLIRGILGLLNPVRGSLILGISAREIGYLSQEAAAKDDFPAGVLEIVLSGFLGSMGLRPFYRSGEKREAEERLRQMGAADLKDRCYRELSGGQRRRVLLARALCGSKKLLVLDEPASGLDPLVREDLYALLQKINREGISVVMVTHDTEAARKYANHILTLRREDVYDFV